MTCRKNAIGESQKKTIPLMRKKIETDERPNTHREPFEICPQKFPKSDHKNL
jgi:hypothetical protein